MLSKRFVPETTATNDSLSESTNYSSISGEDAKNFYLNVVSDSSLEKNKSNERGAGNTPINKLDYKSRKSARKLKETQTCQDTLKLSRNLLSAAQHNDAAKVEEIMSLRPDIINATDSFEWTALMCAVQANAISAIKLLLKYGADISIHDVNGRSATSLCKSEDLKNLLTHKETLPPTDTNMSKRFKIFCKICQQYFESSRKIHNTSIIHIMNSKCPEPKTCYGIPESNKGFQILIKSGWNRENGLGPDGSGHKYPVKTFLKRDRYGVGAVKPKYNITHFSSGDVRAVHNDTNRRYAISKKKKNSQMQRDKQLEMRFRMEFM